VTMSTERELKEEREIKKGETARKRSTEWER
jgi:hypothetical protein